MSACPHVLIPGLKLLPYPIRESLDVHLYCGAWLKSQHSDGGHLSRAAYGSCFGQACACYTAILQGGYTLLLSGMCDMAAGNGAKGGSGGGFNPFGLPSPIFASPVPVTADNRFADVSPMADAPQPSVPAPMRVSISGDHPPEVGLTI